MKIEVTERQLELIKEAKHCTEQLSKVGEVCVLYNQGASAETCMERIRNIIVEE